ncbi:hypothetical protein M378DRAFT_169900 [Amanita muscaria Koide BX008]|uniref:Uncharacterized protein n=1 Tax=Amanita muscaria (strain Koide BX008) TaxID=946122 RepID=A0A0C2S8E1_AMAMK|nr:hypothetical protein M378DRAFT_169900 [Amanita muscaria Koide BX008]
MLPSDDDVLIRKLLFSVWNLVNVTIKEVPQRCQRSKRLADYDSILANVEHKGDMEFSGLLRNIAKKNS